MNIIKKSFISRPFVVINLHAEPKESCAIKKGKGSHLGENDSYRGHYSIGEKGIHPPLLLIIFRDDDEYILQ